MSRLLVLFLFLVFVSVAQTSSPQWEVVDSNYATIAISLSFQTSESGWIGGGTASLQPLVIHTPNAGKTLNNVGIVNVTKGALMSIRMANAQAGVAGSLGFFGLICGAYTNNGVNWTRSHEGDDLICAAQGASAPDSNTFIMIGQWTSGRQPDGDGVQISTDAGQKWKGQDWGQETSARYGWFQSQNLGYVTGGSWPDETSPFVLPKTISKHLTYTGKHIKLAQPSKSKFVPPGYQGIIAKATNKASTWTTLVNLTNEGLYFNQISCTDENNCWAVCEGNNVTNGMVAAWVYATTNGWKTWSTQLYFEGGSLITIAMLNSTFGWAGGAFIGQSDINEPLGLKGTFYKTTDGQTWTVGGTLNDFYAMDLSVIDENNAFSAGVTAIGLSSLARFS